MHAMLKTIQLQHFGSSPTITAELFLSLFISYALYTALKALYMKEISVAHI